MLFPEKRRPKRGRFGAGPAPRPIPPALLLSCPQALTQEPPGPRCRVWGSSPAAPPQLPGLCRLPPRRAQPRPPAPGEVRTPAAFPAASPAPLPGGSRSPQRAVAKPCQARAAPGRPGRRRGQAERGAQGAGRQVAEGDVEQQQVDGGAHRPVTPEERQHQQVAAEARAAHGPQADGRRQPPGGARARARVSGTVRGPAAGRGGGGVPASPRGRAGHRSSPRAGTGSAASAGPGAPAGRGGGGVCSATLKGRRAGVVPAVLHRVAVSSRLRAAAGAARPSAPRGPRPGATSSHLWVGEAARGEPSREPSGRSAAGRGKSGFQLLLGDLRGGGGQSGGSH